MTNINTDLFMLNYFSKTPVPVIILSGPFRGARMILNPASSKRKILGSYEFVLNSWLSEVLQKVEIVWDIGANDGYFTYGCAKVLSQQCRNSQILAFEPELATINYLQTPASWPVYKNVSFEFIPSFVGNTVTKSMTTLDHAYYMRRTLWNRPSLVKIDVEGSEVEVLQGATELLAVPHQWVVEVHGNHLLAAVLELFAAANRPVDVRRLHPHWLWGAETRQIETMWVTTRLD